MTTTTEPMTPEQAADVALDDLRLLELPAGRALDVVIARILGARWHKQKTRNRRILLPPDSVEAKLLTDSYPPLPDCSLPMAVDFYNFVPQYSYNAYESAKLREHMRDKWKALPPRDRCRWKFTDEEDNGWNVCIYGSTPTLWGSVTAGTYDHALCLALVRWAQAREREEQG